MKWIDASDLSKKHDFLIYGKKYKVYREGNFLAVATFTDDAFHGEVFLIITVENGTELKEVCCVDEWEFAESENQE